ncbi:MAG: glutamate--cysteine ligase [Gloeocapsa sp. DLM2.Bin57]|nr:MAG: glutamate--cysteine ligase [Gloeocapsa sp. DLM2.Bin57]
MLLSKGVEVEMYTGTPTGDVVGFSDKIVRDLAGFVREPDSRNVEYTTAPLCSYDRLLCALLKPRQLLRKYLKEQNNYTIIPGSTLALGNSDRFYRCDPDNPYHSFIEATYGTKVVTASIHINIGISDPETLIRACRLIRLEAPLYLALSASSPFLDNQVTGYHSTRWQMFPKTPQEVPLFTSHRHFIDWTEAQLRLGTMRNVRHLWSSVRPNGDRRPYLLNRLELRICDLMVDPVQMLGVIALLEARLTQLMENPELDPLRLSSLSAAEMLELTDSNEQKVAENSLEAQLYHWQNGQTIIAREWIEQLYYEVYPLAKQKGFSCFLSPVKQILSQGNQAQQWLKQYSEGLSIAEIITLGIETMAKQEQELESKICAQLLVA